MKDLLTGSQYYYKVQWMGKWRYLAGLLPAMFFVSLLKLLSFIHVVCMTHTHTRAHTHTHTQTLVASVLLRQIHYHVFKFLSKLVLKTHTPTHPHPPTHTHTHTHTHTAHFRNLLNQGIPMPVQTGAQIPFLIVTYAAIGKPHPHLCPSHSQHFKASILYRGQLS